MMIREKSKRGPVRMRVPMRGTEADYPVVTKKTVNTVGVKGINGSVAFIKQPSNWED